MKIKHVIAFFVVAAVIGFVAVFLIARDNGLYDKIDSPAETVTDVPGQAVTDVEVIELPLDIPQVFSDGLDQGFITVHEYSHLMNAYDNKIAEINLEAEILKGSLLTYNEYRDLINSYHQKVLDSGGSLILLDINKENSILDRLNQSIE